MSANETEVFETINAAQLKKGMLMKRTDLTTGEDIYVLLDDVQTVLAGKAGGHKLITEGFNVSGFDRNKSIFQVQSEVEVLKRRSRLAKLTNLEKEGEDKVKLEFTYKDDDGKGGSVSLPLGEVFPFLFDVIEAWEDETEVELEIESFRDFVWVGGWNPKQ